MADPVNYLSPDARRRVNSLLMAEQFNRPTPQDTAVVERGGIVPLATYADGRTALAWPGMIAEPAQQFYRAATGQITPGTDEFREAGAEVAGAAAVGGLLSPRPRNSVGTFGGRLARTADQEALARAEEMAGRGVPREQIWNDTGWFQGVDGKWRFEIDDSGVPWQQQDGTSIFSDLRSVMPHERLFEAYPDRATTLVMGDAKSREASFDTWPAIKIGGDVPNKRSSGFHEVQHMVQTDEKFARGGNPYEFADQANDVVKELMGRASRGGDPFTVEAQEARDAIWKTIDANRDALGIPTALYRMLAGEVEARAVQKRMNMTADQRRARPPWLDYDVPEDQQIVRFAPVINNLLRGR